MEAGKFLFSMNIVVSGKELSQQKNELTMIIVDSIMVSTELPSKTTEKSKGNLHLRDLEHFGQYFPMFLLVLHSTLLKGELSRRPCCVS
jgi:VanZ family protein